MTARVILVTKKSAYARFVEEDQDPRARQLLRRRDASVAHWMAAHATHTVTLDRVRALLGQRSVHTLTIDRPHAEFDATGVDLVIVVGGDGTLLAASHNVGAVPLLGINSDPARSVGFFCAGRPDNIEGMLDQALAQRLRSTWLTRMQVTLNGRVRSRRVLNEALFSHSVPAAASRYIVRYGEASETQHSSGVWVGTAAGSTGAQYSAGGKTLPFRSRKLQLVVREPYRVDGRKYRLLRLEVSNGCSVSLKSMMQNAALFLDGPYRRICLGLGDVLQFRASNDPLCVLGLERHPLRPQRRGRRRRP